MDVDSVDGQVNSSSGRSPQIDFQAKATSRDIVKSDQIAFPLPLKNYDDLRKEVVVPRLLFLVVMPADEAQWMH